MAVYEVVSPPQPTDAPAPPRRQAAAGAGPGSLRTLWGWLKAWITTCADYHEAARLYEEFRGLPDAELARRCLDRSTLGWDVCRACDRGADRSAG
ncbi:MAG: hypothetical protein AB7O44_11605 [Hyphomicrobiaceae bacterium]